MCDVAEDCADIYSKMSFVDCPLDDSDWKNCPYRWKLIGIHNRAIQKVLDLIWLPADPVLLDAIERQKVK